MTLSVSSYPLQSLLILEDMAGLAKKPLGQFILSPSALPLAFWNIDTLQGKPRQTGVRGHEWQWTWPQLPWRNQSHHRQHERNLTLTLRGASWGQQMQPISHTRLGLIYNEDLLLQLSAYKSSKNKTNDFITPGPYQFSLYCKCVAFSLWLRNGAIYTHQMVTTSDKALQRGVLLIMTTLLFA